MTFMKQYLGFQYDIKQFNLAYCHVRDKPWHRAKQNKIGILLNHDLFV